MNLNLNLSSRKILLIYSIGVVLLSVAPINTKGSLNNINIISLRGDYIVHAMLFVPWTYLNQKISSNKAVWFLVGLAFAGFAEYIQYFLPYRAYNINDLIANCLGVFIGFVSVWILSLFSKKYLYTSSTKSKIS